MPTPPRALTTPTAHTPSHPGLATTHTWLAFPRCLETVFKGCQCVPTPARALTTPTAHTTPPWPAFPRHYPAWPRHYSHLARISKVFREYLKVATACPHFKAANACPHPPAPSPPPPPTPHHLGLRFLATTHTWRAFARCLESI